LEGLQGKGVRRSRRRCPNLRAPHHRRSSSRPNLTPTSSSRRPTPTDSTGCRPHRLGSDSRQSSNKLPWKHRLGPAQRKNTACAYEASSSSLESAYVLSTFACKIGRASTACPKFVRGSIDRSENPGERGDEGVEQRLERPAEAGLLPAACVGGAFEGPIRAEPGCHELRAERHRWTGPRSVRRDRWLPCLARAHWNGAGQRPQSVGRRSLSPARRARDRWRSTARPGSPVDERDAHQWRHDHGSVGSRRRNDPPGRHCHRGRSRAPR
jgi:hypothetical protein